MAWRVHPGVRLLTNQKSIAIVHLRAKKDLNEVVGMEVGGYIENIFRKGSWHGLVMALGVCCTIKNLTYVPGSWEVTSKPWESPK